MKLYAYYRSSASYRARIALNLKGLDYVIVPVNLLKAEQKSEAYQALNPQGLVPLLVDGDASVSQSMAILEYLEETYPVPALLPQNRAERAQVRSLALAIACEVAPLCNLGPTTFLAEHFNATEEQKTQWMHHWFKKGFDAVEAMLAKSSGSFCHKSEPGMADCFLVPQVFNAGRFKFDLAAYPNVLRVSENCNKIPAVMEAHPSKQPDAV